MRNLKKFLALVLSVMMVMSLFITANAKSIGKDGKEQSFKDTAGAEFLTAIEVLNGMDVLKGRANPTTGEVEGFFPDDHITRAEVAALVFRLSTGLTETNAANHYAQYGNFSDVPKDAWYAGYVGYCANAGYIKGYDPFEGGRFGPNDKVTGYQATAMILRAMGWGANGEFEGGNWALNVASVGTQNGILRTVNSTHFGNATLYEYAPRQVVAEIYLRAAMTGCVVYTPAYGYQTTQINTATGANIGINTLGYRYFGLNKTTRVILGNQATGEDWTVLGSEWNAAESNNPYAYPGSVIEWNDPADPTQGAKTTAGVGLTLKVETPLEWFGHKVTAYYNVNNGRTYAIYDEAKETYVYSADGDITGSRAKLAGLASSAGYSVDKAAGAYTSDRYGWISATRQPTAAAFAAITDGTGYEANLYNNGDATTSKIAEDNSDATKKLPYGTDSGTVVGGSTTDGADPYGNYEAGSYYKLINNGNGLDVVITVAPELARVTEHDTTASVKTLRLSGQSDGTMGGSPWKPSTFGEADNGIIRMDSVTPGSATDIDDLVVAWEIKGTNYEVNYNDEIIKGDDNLYNYWLQPVATKVTGTVKYYNGLTGEVTLSTTSGEKTLKWTNLPIINGVSSPALDKDGLGNAYFYDGEEYTFYIDPTDASRYVDFTQGNDYEFLYTTYGDYSLGGLGTAELGYYVTGVNWNGEVVENKLVKTIDLVGASGSNYEPLSITKKNLGSAANGNTIGNEIQNGYYTGYGYNAGTNDLDTKDAGLMTSADNWTGHTQLNRYWDGKLISSLLLDKTETDTAGVWTVNKGNVADGWSDVVNVGGSGQIGELLLTPGTKFIIVDGIGIKGSANAVNVKTYNGIGELLGNSNDVTINVKRFAADGITQLPDYNVYYKLAKDQYNNKYKDDSDLAYSDNNNKVGVVILPKDAIKWSDNSNLWFTNKTGYNPIYLPGKDVHGDIQNLTMWHNGEKENVYVDVSKGSLAGNPIVDNAKYGMFYKLTEIYKVGDTPIYQADRMDYPEMDNIYLSKNSATICNLDLVVNYTATNEVNTARLTQVTTDGWTPGSAAINTSDVYNVTGAKVTNVSGVGQIANVRELSNAVSVGYEVTVSIVNDGHHVSQIYVTNVRAPGEW